MSATPLGEKLKALIAAGGPMSVADYMAHCLGDPEHGYYTTRDPFGAGGDFITAPEVSQMFGEIVGAWLAHLWQSIGAPSPVRLVELGPGRGTLMADILRVAKKLSDFDAAVSVHLVETSPVLKTRQAETLRACRREIAWHSTFDDVPEGPLLVVANEFFDALPVRQFVRVGDVWRERVVGLDADGNLAFGIGAATLGGEPNAPEGSIQELTPASDAIVSQIARRIADGNGAALIIDYGYSGPATGETLQAVRAHEYSDPLAAPGEADLTAHVDFTSLAVAARAEGAATHGPMPQGAFLDALGLSLRAERLSAGADDATRAAIARAAERLSAPDKMGALFKAMAITRSGMTPPPFPAD